MDSLFLFLFRELNMSKLIPSIIIINILNILVPTVEDNPFNEDIIEWELFSLRVQKLLRNKKGITYNELKKGLRNIDCEINQYPYGKVDADVILLNKLHRYN